MSRQRGDERTRLKRARMAQVDPVQNSPTCAGHRRAAAAALGVQGVKHSRVSGSGQFTGELRPPRRETPQRPAASGIRPKSAATADLRKGFRALQKPKIRAYFFCAALQFGESEKACRHNCCHDGLSKRRLKLEARIRTLIELSRQPQRAGTHAKRI